MQKILFSIIFLLSFLLSFSAQSQTNADICSNPKKSLDEIRTLFYSEYEFKQAVTLAKGLYSECLSKFRNDKNLTSAIYEHYAVVFRSSNLSEYEEFLRIIDEGIDWHIRQLGALHTRTIKLEVQKAYMMMEAGENNKSLALHKQILEKFKQPTDFPLHERGRVYTRLGSLYRKLSQLQQSAEALMQAISLFERDEQSEDYDFAWAYNNLGNTYGNMGQPKESMAFYNRALKLFNKAYPGSHPSLAGIYNNIGTLYHIAGDLDDALPLYRKSIDTYLSFHAEDHPRIALVQNNLGELYLDKGNLEKAEQYFSAAINTRKKVNKGLNTDLAWTYSYIASLYLSKGMSNNALEMQQSAIDLWQKMAGKVPFARISVLKDASQMSLASGNIALAVDYQNQILDVVTDYMVGFVFDEKGFISAKAKATPFIEQAIQFSVGLNETSLNNIKTELAWRAFQLNSWNEVSIRNGLSLLRNTQSLEDSKTLLALLRKKSSYIEQLSNVLQQDPEQLQGVLLESSNLNLALDQRLDALAISRNDIIELIFPFKLGVRDVVEALSDAQVLVFFYSGELASYSLVVTSDSLQLVKNKIESEQLNEYAKRVLTSVQLDTLNLFDPLKPFDVEAAYHLYRALLAPMEHILSEKSQLLVVKSHSTEQLPFQLLLTESAETSNASNYDYSNLSWLMNKISVTRLSSLFAQEHSTRPQSNRLLALGAPILGAEATHSLRGETFDILDEQLLAIPSKLKTLSSLPNALQELKVPVALSADSNVLLGEDALESSLKSMDLSDYSIIAIATHALIATNGTEYKHGLVLTPPDSASEYDDGFLAYDEIQQLNVNADIVVLSGCSTGTSEDGLSAGTLGGIASSFLYAGSESVLVSHWPVEDRSTSIIMTRFYQNIMSGKPRSWSLKDAQRHYLSSTSNPFYTHPAFWASFEVVEKDLKP